jgi:hypothetical protein
MTRKVDPLLGLVESYFRDHLQRVRGVGDHLCGQDGHDDARHDADLAASVAVTLARRGRRAAIALLRARLGVVSRS